MLCSLIYRFCNDQNYYNLNVYIYFLEAYNGFTLINKIKIKIDRMRIFNRS